MQYCQLSQDLSVSRIITGLWQIADMERSGQLVDPNKASHDMERYVNAGLTTFDMADHYGSAEEITGFYNSHFESSKDGQFLTKWVPSPGKIDFAAAEKAVYRALDRMKKDSIDLLQYHAWNYADPVWIDTLGWLQQLCDKGLIKNLGLTNVDADHLKMALDTGFDIVSNQVCYSLLDQRASGKMTTICLEYGTKLLAFGVLAGGFLTSKWLDHKEPSEDKLSTWSEMKYLRFIQQAGGWSKYQQLLQVVRQIAEKHGVSIANVAARHILDQPATGAIIIGARLNKHQHIEDNLAVLKLHLDEDDRSKIKEAQGALSAVPGDCGDEYRKPPFLTASGDLSHHLDEMPLPYEAINLPNGRIKVLSGTVWEDIAGFSRAIRTGDRICVSGTTATNGHRLIGGDDAESQTHFILDKIEGAIVSLGGSLEDIVRTRIYISRYEDWEKISRVHGQRLGHIQPANTLIRADLIGNGYLVEIEAEASVSS